MSPEADGSNKHITTTICKLMHKVGSSKRQDTAFRVGLMVRQERLMTVSCTCFNDISIPHKNYTAKNHTAFRVGLMVRQQRLVRVSCTCFNHSRDISNPQKNYTAKNHTAFRVGLIVRQQRLMTVSCTALMIAGIAASRRKTTQQKTTQHLEWA